MGGGAIFNSQTTILGRSEFEFYYMPFDNGANNGPMFDSRYSLKLSVLTQNGQNLVQLSERPRSTIILVMVMVRRNLQSQYLGRNCIYIFKRDTKNLTVMVMMSAFLRLFNRLNRRDFSWL